MNRIGLLGLAGLTFAVAVVAEPLELTPSKDTFGRSNKRNRNSGASEFLLIAHAPNIRTLVAFDLSGVTNEIIGAEFRFRAHNDSSTKVNLVVAPLVNTPNNIAWGEGQGNLGVQGQNSKFGEACYAFSAFNDAPWESAPGVPAVNLGDAKLWGAPLAILKGVAWEEDRWIRVPIKDVTVLEKIRRSDLPSITFGVWGNAGNGFYFISSKNSKWSPILHLDVKGNKGE